MRIEEDLKLGFKDVLIRPKRSTLKKPLEVELERQFTFSIQVAAGPACRLSPLTWTRWAPSAWPRPWLLSTFSPAVHKHYSVEQWADFVQRMPESVLRHVMVSTGTSEADFAKMQQILALSPALKFICIDVANGYSEHFVAFPQKAREACPESRDLRRQRSDRRDGGRAYPSRRRHR